MHLLAVIPNQIAAACLPVYSLFDSISTACDWVT